LKQFAKHNAIQYFQKSTGFAVYFVFYRIIKSRILNYGSIFTDKNCCMPAGYSSPHPLDPPLLDVFSNESVVEATR